MVTNEKQLDKTKDQHWTRENCQKCLHKSHSKTGIVEYEFITLTQYSPDVIILSYYFAVFKITIIENELMQKRMYEGRLIYSLTQVVFQSLKIFYYRKINAVHHNNLSVFYLIFVEGYYLKISLIIQTLEAINQAK